MTVSGGKAAIALRYALAPACIGASVLLHVSPAGPLFHPMGLFILGVVAAAWFGGPGPGVFAAFLSAIALPHLIAVTYPLSLAYPLLAGVFDLPRFITLGLTGGAVGWGTSSLRRTETALRERERELSKARDELEIAVAERTAHLAASEERYARAMQASKDGIWEWNPATDEFFMSDGARRLWAVPEGVAVRTRAELKRLGGFHPEDFQRTEEAIAENRKLRAHGFDMEYRVIGPEGEVRWVRSQAKAFPGADGPALVTGSLTDITERKLADLALAESGARFRSLTELSSDFFWETDTEHRYTAIELGRAYAGVRNNASKLGLARWEIAYASRAGRSHTPRPTRRPGRHTARRSRRASASSTSASRASRQARSASTSTAASRATTPRASSSATAASGATSPPASASSRRCAARRSAMRARWRPPRRATGNGIWSVARCSIRLASASCMAFRWTRPSRIATPGRRASPLARASANARSGRSRRRLPIPPKPTTSSCPSSCARARCDGCARGERCFARKTGVRCASPARPPISRRRSSRRKRCGRARSATAWRWRPPVTAIPTGTSRPASSTFPRGCSASSVMPLAPLSPTAPTGCAASPFIPRIARAGKRRSPSISPAARRSSGWTCASWSRRRCATRLAGWRSPSSPRATIRASRCAGPARSPTSTTRSSPRRRCARARRAFAA